MSKLCDRLGRDIVKLIVEFVPRVQYEWWVWHNFGAELIPLQQELLCLRPSIVQNNTDRAMLGFCHAEIDPKQAPSFECAVRILVVGNDTQVHRLWECIPNNLVGDVLIQALKFGMSESRLVNCVTKHIGLALQRALLVRGVAQLCTFSTFCQVESLVKMPMFIKDVTYLMENGCRDFQSFQRVLGSFVLFEGVDVSSKFSRAIIKMDWSHLFDDILLAVWPKLENNHRFDVFKEAVHRKDKHRATLMFENSKITLVPFYPLTYGEYDIETAHFINTCLSFCDSETNKLTAEIERVWPHILHNDACQEIKLFDTCAAQGCDYIAQRLWDKFDFQTHCLVIFGLTTCKFTTFLINRWSHIRALMTLSRDFFARLALRSSNATLWNLLRDNDELPREEAFHITVPYLISYLTSDDLVIDDRYLQNHHEHIISFALVFNNIQIANHVLLRYSAPRQGFLKSMLRTFVICHMWQALDRIKSADDISDAVIQDCFSIAIRNNDVNTLRALWRLRPLTLETLTETLRTSILSASVETMYFFCQQRVMVREITLALKQTQKLHEIAFDIDFASESLLDL